MVRPLVFLGCLLLPILAGCPPGPDDTDGKDDTASPAADVDGDGSPVGEDCDDRDPDVHPGAPDICNGRDDDCDGERDEDPDVDWFADEDHDGFGDAGAPLGLSCDPLDGVMNGADCDDGDGGSFPGATEVCDGRDNDCDGAVDDEVALFVAAGAEDGGDGSEDAPFGTIQAAVDAGGECISIGPGTYTEQVQVLGGSLRMVGSGGPENTVIDGQWTMRPLALWLEDGDAVQLQGLTLANGYVRDGGGCLLAYCDSGENDGCTAGTLDLEDIVITGCSTTGYGGGMYLHDMDVTFRELFLDGNSAQYYGGGAQLVESTLQGSGLQAASNVAGTLGGALYAYRSSMELDHAQLKYNWANYGGALYLYYTSEASLSAVEVVGNQSFYSGGVYVYYSSKLDVENGIFVGNTSSSGYGGALETYNASSVTLTNVSVVGNGGIAALANTGGGSSLYLDNAVLAYNDGYGAYLGSSSSWVKITYTDIWENASGDWYAPYGGITDDETNLAADPRFVLWGEDATTWDLHLDAESACIDQGNPAIEDRDGSRSDMGAYGGPGGSW